MSGILKQPPTDHLHVYSQVIMSPLKTSRHTAKKQTTGYIWDCTEIHYQ